MPTLILIVKKEIFLNYLEKYNLLFLINEFTIEEILFLLLGFILVVTIFKVFLSVFINYYKFKYFTNIQHELSKKLLNKYLDLDFEKFSELSSGKLVNNIKLELERTCSFFQTLLDLMIEAILMVVIISIILFVNFKISISFILFIFLFFLYFLFIYKILFNQVG